MGAGDVINYTITVRNIGNVTLTGLTVSDTLTDGNSTTLNMSTGPSFSGSDAGSNSGMLLAGETATYIAYYIISDAAAATGRIVNIAQATAYLQVSPMMLRIYLTIQTPLKKMMRLQWKSIQLLKYR